MSCGVRRRHSSDPSLVWLWCRPVASALIGSLAWEPLYAMGVALKSKKKTISHKQRTVTATKHGIAGPSESWVEPILLAPPACPAHPTWLRIPYMFKSPRSLPLGVLVLSACFSAVQGFSSLNHRSCLPKRVDMSVGFEQPSRLF